MRHNSYIYRFIVILTLFLCTFYSPEGEASYVASNIFERKYVEAESSDNPEKSIAIWRDILEDTDIAESQLTASVKQKIILNIVYDFIQDARSGGNISSYIEAIKATDDVENTEQRIWALIVILNDIVDTGNIDESSTLAERIKKNIDDMKNPLSRGRAAYGLSMAILSLKNGQSTLGEDAIFISKSVQKYIESAIHRSNILNAASVVRLSLNGETSILQILAKDNKKYKKETKDKLKQLWKDNLKAGDIKKALLIANAIPLNYRSERNKALQKIFDEAVKKDLFRVAIDAIGGIEKTKEQSKYYLDYMKKLLKDKQISRALRIAELIDDGYLASDAWGLLAKLYYKNGYYERVANVQKKAYKNALSLKSKERRSKALLLAAKRIAESGNALLAIKALEKKGYSEKNISVYAAIIKMLAESGKIDMAIKVLGKFSGNKSNEIDKSRLAIIKSLVGKNRADEAKSILISISDSEYIAEATKIIEKSSKSKKYKIKAEKDISTISNSNKRDNEYKRLAVALVNAGDIEESVRIARYIEADVFRAKTYRKIAEIQAIRIDVHNLLSQSTKKNKINRINKVDIEKYELETAAISEKSKNNVIIRDVFPSSSMGSEVPAIKYPERLKYDHAYINKIIPLASDAVIKRIYYTHNVSNRKFASVNGNAGFTKHQNTMVPEVIYVQSGIADIPAIYDAMRVQGKPDYIIKKGNVYILRRPIIVGQNGTLLIDGENVDELKMSAEAGAYIVNSGKLYITGTTVEAWLETKKKPAFATYKDKSKFRPFITSWSGSETYMGGTRFIGLGYSNAKSYGISTSAGPKKRLKAAIDKIKRPEGIIVDNSLDNMLYGYYAYEADNVSLIGNEYVRNIVYGLDPHDRSNWLTMAYNTAYDTQEKHGIIISREVNGSEMIGNISFDNKGSGFMLDRMSVETMFYANTAFGNTQDGLTLFESGCNMIANNSFFHNKRSGIRIRNSTDVAIYQNSIVKNKEAGIQGYSAKLEGDAHALRDFELDHYAQIASMNVINNTIESNGSGIYAARVSALIIKGNKFINQSPKVLRGKIFTDNVSRLFKHDMNDKGVFITKKCVDGEWVPYSCKFRDNGFFDGDGQQGLSSRFTESTRCYGGEA